MRTCEFSQAIADTICERLAEGESLRAICRDEAMPAISTVFKWLGNPELSAFVEQYARAREAQAETFAHEIIEIADEECTMVRSSKHPGARPDDESGDLEVVFDATAVARNRLRVDSRKWVAARILPKKYGDKIHQELTGKDGKDLLPSRVEVVAVSAE